MPFAMVDDEEFEKSVMGKEEHQAKEISMKIKFFSNNFPSIYIDFICPDEPKYAKEGEKLFKLNLVKSILLISFK